MLPCLPAASRVTQDLCQLSCSLCLCRVYSPVTFGKKYDKEGKFIRYAAAPVAVKSGSQVLSDIFLHKSLVHPCI